MSGEEAMSQERALTEFTPGNEVALATLERKHGEELAALRRELEAEITRLHKRWADDYAVLDAVSRELTAEKARFEEHHAAWLENHKYLAGRAQDAITTLIDIARMGKKAGSESAKHRLTQMGIDWESGEPLRDYGRMT